MLGGMKEIQLEIQLPKPNPEDWTSLSGAANMLARSRQTVRDMIERGVLREYVLDGRSMFWVPEVRELRKALDRVAGR